jgi:hypothetical protein
MLQRSFGVAAGDELLHLPAALVILEQLKLNYFL